MNEQSVGKIRAGEIPSMPPAQGLPATPMARQIIEHGTLRTKMDATPTPRKVMGAIGLLVFLAVNAAIAYVVIDGRLDGRWYDIRDLGVGVGELREWLSDEGAPAWVEYWATGIIGGVGILSVLGGWLLIGSWVERRVIALFQIRRGPNRHGPFGLLQPLADAIKLIQKEVLVPRGADRFLYFLPPVLIFIPAMLGWGPVPWAKNMAYVDINVGLLYTVAISSLAVIAVFIAGWSSNNHYALLGAMRTVAMMICYEIPVSLALLTVVLLTGSLQLSEIVAWQASHNVWLIFIVPFAAFTYLFSSTAEINRTPNDIAEAESEIVAGFHTEYSGMKAGLFLAVEMGNALLIGALMATFFMGGYTLFGLEEWVPGYLILLGKTTAMYLVFVWLRATLPRFRLDQLMGYAWKFLIPLAILQVFVVAIEASIFARWDVPGVVSLTLFAVVNLAITAALVRGWAQAIGYSPKGGAGAMPLLATVTGGLKAAERMRAAG
ncbi:MAG: NADH-quinone oxidoreductase subunit NuoH [Dehalococcoidia bacterium]|nr:NADH-quinone oxidoreductase subunit NuoH [Dehalococcoidia bacterium]